MAYPITGPFSRVHESNEQPPGSPAPLALNKKIQIWYRQKRPYDRPLPYSYQNHITHQVSDWPHLQSPNSSGGISGYQAFSAAEPHRFGDGGSEVINDLLSDIRNRVRAKLDSQISDPSSMLTALAESNQTLAMVTNKIQMFHEFTTRWNRRQYRSAIRVVLKAQSFKDRRKEARRRARLRRLEAQPLSKLREKSLASAWIETWFGWLPTIGDVQKSLSNLSRDFPDEYYTAKSGFEYNVWGHKGFVFGQAGCTVKITNPNLYLASQLGLTNPVYTAFELLPYSWLLAWFGNLEQFFRQWSTFHGTYVYDSWNTVGMKDSHEFIFTGVPWSTRPSGRSTCFSFRREPFLPEVTLRWKGINRLSATRGATLASLLTLRISNDSLRDLRFRALRS